MEKYKYNYFIEIIDEIRKNRKITVEELVENIISVRTYFRYYNYEQEVKLDTIYSLSKKLNITLSDMIFYKLHTKEKTSYFNDFLIYLTRNKHSKCEFFYQSLLNNEYEADDKLIVIKCLLKRYAFEKKEISLDDYLSFLEEKFLYIKKNNFDSMYIDYFYTLYWLTFESIDNNIFEKVINFCKTNGIRKDILLYYYLIPKVVHKLIDIKYDLNTVRNILSEFKNCVTFVRPDIYAINDYYKCMTRLHFIANENEEFKENLYKYIMGSFVIKSKKEIEEEARYIEDNYHFNVKDLVINKSNDRLNEYRNIKNSEIKK